MAGTQKTVQVALQFPKALLHKAIIAKCEKLFLSEHYAQAVEWSFKVVRDRLRQLTGRFETGSEAFGKGKLHVKGAIARHVDGDFNDGVKFLTMAIDKFRNEKSHTSEIGVNDPTKALQYLILSSLAMRLLDSAEIEGMED
ncbi:MAG: TIGR02391 family protein [Roseiarcus sp.]